MKLYAIPQNTNGVLFTKGERQRLFTTRKDLSFLETITDPVRYANGSRINFDFDTLAQQGYFIFGGDFGSDTEAKYILAVHGDNIQVF